MLGILLEIDTINHIADSLRNIAHTNPHVAFEFSKFDQWGFGITLVGMGVVFLALFLL